MINSFIFFFTAISFITLFFFNKFNILVDKKIEKHKKHSANNKSILLGGTLILLFLGYYYLFVNNNPKLFLFLTSLFLIGLMSDLRQINSVSLRFLLQLIIVFCFVSLLNIEINHTKIKLIDELLEYNLLNIFFVSFCLLVLVNGTNFIDGINGVVITYYFIVALIILLNLNHFVFDKDLLINISLILSILFFFNLCGVLYLGDSGSYVLSLLFGIFLIDFALTNGSISPYFIILLFWYPCFELLFSMIRRVLKKTKTYKPDTAHFHQLIHKKIKKKLNGYNNLTIHFLTNSIINLYNLVCFVIALNFIYNSELLILIIIVNIFSYIVFYKYLKK